jgi:anti-anti-sigma factor
MSPSAPVRSSGPVDGTPFLADVVACMDHFHVCVRGELDRGNRQEMSELIRELVGAGHRHVVVDLSALAFCDLGGFRGLMDADEILRGAGGELTVVGASPLLRWVVERTRPACRLQLDGAGSSAWPVGAAQWSPDGVADPDDGKSA